MIKENEAITMGAIALCFKRFLKPEEAMIYCNLQRIVKSMEYSKRVWDITTGRN